MTREELRDYVDEQRTLNNIPYHVYSALIDGIDTLEHEPCKDCISRQAVLKYIESSEAELGHSSENELVCQDIKEMPPVTPQQKPCDDCISRQAVLDTMSELNAISFYEAQEDSNECYHELRKAMEQLPSVTPQTKVGHWIEVIDEIDSLGNKTWHHKCSMCGNEDSGFGDYKYCPNCGAKMAESDE